MWGGNVKLDENAKGIFDEIEQRSNISIDEIYNIANSIQHADLSDEGTVRSLVRRLSQMANRPVSQEKEDKIVHAIINNDVPNSMESLQRFFG